MLFSQIVDGEGNGLTETQTDELLFGACYETVNKSDYAIVLGTLPKYAAVRARIAASFYHAGGTANLIVSGAAVSNPGVTEAAFMRDELIKHGVPKSAVIEEPNACDTVQNMTCSLTEICKRRDIMTVDAVTVISEPFHMCRTCVWRGCYCPTLSAYTGILRGRRSSAPHGKRTRAYANACVWKRAFCGSLYYKGE